MIKVGLVGYGKAGQAVAQVLQEDPRFELCWVVRKTALQPQTVPESDIPIARLLRQIAPSADVEILEQDFRAKPEVSGTARKIAQSLQVQDERITSLRLGGVVGHHEVIFGFPYQTVRLIHNSIERRAFGAGAAFALTQLAQCEPGFYTFEDLMTQLARKELLGEHSSRA